MSCKNLNLLLTTIFCSLALAAGQVKAQGLVSLSEEAMFDDGLDTEMELPAQEVPNITEEGQTSPELPIINAPKQSANAPLPLANDVLVSEIDIVEEDNNNGGAEELTLLAEQENATAEGTDLFSQMSDIEKRTALLNLELKREKLKNEIEAVKNQRRQALQQEKERIEQLKLKNLAFEKEQEQKVLVEQQKLRDLDIKFETLRQERVLGAYKNKMLEENQLWIENNAKFYKQIEDLRNSKKALLEDMKTKVTALNTAATDAKKSFMAKVDQYEKDAENLRAQIDILRQRTETLERENEQMRNNPFANGSATPNSDEDSSAEKSANEPVETDLSQLYAVTEIRGQGGELVAKLLNTGGVSFYVKKGTALQSGHIVDEITTTYVAASKGSSKSYLYFSAGGIVPMETSGFQLDPEVAARMQAAQAQGSNASSVNNNNSRSGLISTPL